MLSVGAALVVAGALNVWHEAGRYLAYKRETLLATAQVFGAATSHAVATGDAVAVGQSIRAIARVPGVVRAEVEDRGGARLAEAGSTVRLESDLDLDDAETVSPRLLLGSGTVGVSVPIIESGERVGRLILVSDTADLPARFQGALLSALAGTIGAVAIGLVLSHRLQRSITRPLLSLTAAMADVERTNELRPLAALSSDHETGVLTRGFNSMIETIRTTRDQILAREDEIIVRLSRAGEQRDDQTGQHVVRVAKLSRIIADKLELDPAFTDELVRASPMHDVGKISVSDAILYKPGRLDPDERREMQRHAQAGYSILAGSYSTLVRLAAEIALSHHERWDGTGYPHGLAAAAIPLSGRITAVADVCDALLSVRPYKPAWSLEQVRAHLIENAGTHFDPDCVTALVACWSKVEKIYAPHEVSDMPSAGS